MDNCFTRWIDAENSPRWLKAGAIAGLMIVAILTQACNHAAGGGLGGGTGGVAPTAGPLSAQGTIVEQPRGGVDVTELTVAFEMSEIPSTGTAPVAITVSWAAPCGTHKTEGFLFAGGSQSFTSTYSEGGFPITMNFRAIITWEDADGTHRIQSDAAVCR